MKAAVKQETSSMDVDSQEDESDEIVREIDVYVSPELSDQLYLLQFPLQHGQVPLANSARIKKKHGLLELEHAIPANIGTEGNYFLPSRKQTSHVIPVSTHMALGRLRDDGALHLVPLNHITQMRPDFGHVDEADPNALEETKETDTAQSKLEKKPLLFQRKESERAALARKSSYAYKRSNEEGEEWQELDVCGPTSKQYAGTDLKITSQHKSTSIAARDGKNFVKSLDYLPARTHASNEESQEDVSPLVNVVKRLVGMLAAGVPVPYSVIRPQFPPTIDDNDLLTALASCAVLVRGNFCLHSRLLTWEPEIAAARTFILLLLHTVGHVQRPGLLKVFEDTSVSSEWIHDILLKIALRRSNGWLPRLADNVEFVYDFAEHVQLHDQYWARVAQKHASKLEIYKDAINA